MIPTSNHESRQGARVRLVVIHTTEGATDVGSLGAFFQHGTDQASYHAAFDDNKSEQYVDYSEASWSILSGNKISDNAAMCVAAVRDAWSRDRWLQHPAMLERCAAWIALRCTARGLPITRLSYSEVGACKNNVNHPGGVIEHHDWTVGANDGTHNDCGSTLPWDIIIPRARQLAGGVPLVLRRSHRRDEENSMLFPPSTTRIDMQIPTDVVGGWCGAANLLLNANTGGALVYSVMAVVDRGSTPPLVTTLLGNPNGQNFVQWWPLKKPLPAGTTSVVVNYTAPAGMVAHVEYEN